MSDSVVSTESEAGANGEGWGLRAWGMLAGVGLALLPMLVRLQSPMDLLPYWDGDPVNQESVVIGVTPSVSLMGDLVSILGAALLLACGPRRGLKSLAPMVLVGVGAWACLWHMPARGFDAKTAVTGGAWLSGAVVAFALWFAGKDRRVRLVAFALIVGAVGLLAAKGVYQVVVEHPGTVAAYQRDKAAILARNGWQEGSAMAKAYERRLMQSEATGWFGFANVYASFAAMGFAVFAVMLIGLFAKRKDEAEDNEDRGGGGVLAVASGGLIVSSGALFMAGAKGGYVAAALGVGVGLVLMWLRSERGVRLRPAAWLIGPLVMAAPLATIVVRGAVGERVGELSLLFRWFYMQGAARIFGANWQHGVGPDGFQPAYALAKNPLSPEDVTSPHSVMWDWAACLGVGGLALAAWLVWSSTRLGPAAVRAGHPASGSGSADETRKLMRVVCIVAALAAMVAIPMQYASLLPEEAFIVRIGGLVVWCVLSCGVLAATRVWRGWPVALGAGAAVLLAHAQIEISGVWVQSCGLVLALVAVAASGCSSKVSEGSEASSKPANSARFGWLPPTAGVLGCGVAAFLLLGPTYMTILGGTKLLRSYMLLEPVRDGRAELAAAVRDRAQNAPVIAQKLREIEPGLVAQAVWMLPPEWPASRSASQMAMQLAQAYRHDTSTPDSAARSQAWAVNAVALVVVGHDRDLHDLLAKPVVSNAEAAAAFTRIAALPTEGLDTRTASWAATVCIASAGDGIAPSPQAWLELTAKHLSEARKTDPYNPAHLQRLMDVYERLGRAEEARATAKDLLAVDALQRLDRAVRGLSEKDKARAERIAGGTGGSGVGVSPGTR